MFEPKLSVIITNYNYGEYLQDCIESVLNQIYQPYEIIIADDASTDNSIEIIKAYEKKYPHIRGLYNIVNMKLAKNKHNAIMQAKGDYIRTIDSDDYLYDKEVLVKEMALTHHYKTQNKNIIAFSKRVLVDVNGNLIYFEDKDIPQGYILEGIIKYKGHIPRDFIMSKEQYFSVGGFEKECQLYVDWCLILKLAAKYDFYYSGSNGAVFRRHGSGMSSADIAYRLKWQLFSFKKFLYCLKGIEKFKAYVWFYTFFLKRVFFAYLRMLKIYPLLKKLKNNRSSA